MSLVHHDLCFGCGRTNLFGVLLEVHELEAGVLGGRCFIKQDHQGAERGVAHEGVVTAALSDAMALACGRDARPRRIEVELIGPAPVGSFIQIEARAGAAGDRTLGASATATTEQGLVARAIGTYTRP